MSPGVDVVAGPARYPRTPILLLVFVAIVPIVALTAAVLWSDRRADEYEGVDAPADVDAEQADQSVTRSVTPPASALTTSLLSLRRTPGEVASIVSEGRLADQVEPIYGFLDDRSCVAVSVNGRSVTTYNATSPVIPASNQKILTAAVALEILGPDHRFTTAVVGPPPIDGVVEGDVYLVGGGDPLLTAADFPIADDTYPAFNVTSLDELADSLATAGVTGITGSVIGDGSRYDDEFAVDTWAEGVAGVDAGPYDALMVNDARTLGRSSRQADPNDAAARELVRLLGRRGVSVGGGWATGTATEGLTALGSVESAALPAVVAEMLTTSDNNTAELLLKEIGLADSGEGTRTAGLNAVDRTLREWGVPIEGVRPLDGSGLSVDNRVTCAAVLAVLQHASDDSLSAAMALAGRTGTLVDEFIGSVVEGRLVGKTGTLDNEPVAEDPPSVKSLAGYLPASNGDRIEYVMILNSPDISLERRFEPFWLAFAERLDSYPNAPERVDIGPR